ncbi:hypothetical protein [Mycobacterium adipatum]|uniref:hypothetical protein n=1 Tax=Mycobacterium adipatum TaxID=1682113 RepID=UPI0012E894AC|nr:hypothetical protein [Mycobacterium adipatum]
MGHRRGQTNLRLAASRAADDHKPVFTIADVARECGLPQPVIVQLVPRTWTAQGWMYSASQIRAACAIAAEVKAAR